MVECPSVHLSSHSRLRTEKKTNKKTNKKKKKKKKKKKTKKKQTNKQTKNRKTTIKKQNRNIFCASGFFFLFDLGQIRPFQEYFTYIEPIVHQRWAKTREPGEKPPDHP